MFPQFKKLSFTSNYGIDEKRFQVGSKVKNSFIYSSFPNRGLVVLLKMWPRIISEFPDSTLNIYCNLEQEWVNKVAPVDMREIKALLKVNKKGITVHGWVNKEKLAEAWKRAEYWLYPCTFEETFCLTAVEAAITKTFAVTNHLAALAETVSDRGLIIHGNPREQKWQDLAVQELKKFMSGTSNKEPLITSNYEWAKQKSWEVQTKKFMELIQSLPEKVPEKVKEILPEPKHGSKVLVINSSMKFPENVHVTYINKKRTYNGLLNCILKHEYFDYIFIESDPFMETVIVLSWKLLKIGGILVGCDLEKFKTEYQDDFVLVNGSMKKIN